MSKLCFCEEPYWRRSVYISIIHEIWERCDVASCTAEKIVHVDLNWRKKLQQMKTLSSKIMAKETGYLIFKGLAQNVWAMGTQTPLQHCHRWWNQAVPLLHPSQTIQSDVGSWWWEETSCALTRFPVPEMTIFLLFFSTDRVQSRSTFNHRSQHALQHTMLKLF